MGNLLLWLLALLWGGAIYYFGRAGFGRADSQRWLDRLKNHPGLRAFFNRHHSKFRAAFHYVEFGAGYFILYFAASGGYIGWDYARGLGVWIATSVLAFLDELHQKASGGRCFRRIDLLHSILGASLIMLLCFFLRG